MVALGPLPPTEPMSVLVGLAPPSSSGVSGLLSALYTPGTPEYQHFLSTAALAARFGATPSSVAAAESYFERFGLGAVESPDHLLLTVTGPSGRVAEAFGTTFEEFASPGGGWFVSHPTAATLPPVAPWSGVLGLGNATPLVPANSGVVRAPEAVTPGTGCSALGVGLDPCQVWQAYNMSSLIAGGTNGSGVRIAVVDAYSSAEDQADLTSDLNEFASREGISADPVNFLYPVPGSGDLNVSSNPDWNAEDALDLEWARASAPGATIDMTFSPNSGVGLYEAVDWIVAHQAADVISMSWGEPDVGVFNGYSTPCASACNASTDGSYGILAPVLAFAAAEGISVFAASGDCGSADGTSGVSTNFPASDPDVTGVGGTVLSVGTSGWLGEVGWSGNATGATSPGCENQGGSGGGYSPFPRPWWQQALPASPGGRGVPDVALDAGTPVGIFLNGEAAGIEGTSVATPIWAGIAAIADQSAGGALGFLDPALYAIALSANYATDFHDIVAGNNGYAARPGWDPVTGLGSPIVASLVTNLVRPPTSPTSLAAFAYATPRFGRAPLTVTFGVNATGGSGTYPLEGVSFGDGNASFAANGSTSHTYVSAGVYSAQAYVADSSGNFSLSPPVAVVVGGGTALNVTLTASTDRPSVGVGVGFSVTVSGGLAPYTFNYSFGDGTFLVNATTGSVTHVYGASGAFCAAVVVADSADPPDGGASGRVALGVGGVALPNCRNDTAPLTVAPLAGVGVRDAPADFPSLFTTSGGSSGPGALPPTIQYSSSDPYVAACGCAIFRTAGTYAVTGYANDSENEQASAATSVTVAPPLVAQFTASTTYGVAPLTVAFSATASGGDGASAGLTAWSSGTGLQSVGASASFTYPTPGMYIAVGHLTDRGDGNASEAFVIDVQPPSGGSPVFLAASIAPATDVALGATVNVSAGIFTATGAPVPSDFAWSLPDGSGAYRPAANWTFSTPLPGAGNRTFEAEVHAIVAATGAVLAASVVLPQFVAQESGGWTPSADALVVSVSSGPGAGPAPFPWSASASLSGPGTSSVTWSFGDGTSLVAGSATHSFAFGRYTVGVTARDSWGDEATDVRAVGATEALAITASLSATSGPPLLTVAFHASAAGGVGPAFAYRWTFGDGSNAAGPNVTHLFVLDGTYRVTLAASDLANDSANESWTVTIGASVSGPAGFPTSITVVLLAVGVAVGVGLAAAVALRRRAPPQPGVTP